MRLMKRHQVTQPYYTVVRAPRVFDLLALLQGDVGVHRLICLLSQKIADNLGRRVVLHLFDQPLLVKVFIVE